MSNPLNDYDVQKIVKGADVEKDNAALIVAIIVCLLGIGLLAYAPGCAKRNADEQNKRAAALVKEQEHIPATTPGLETIMANPANRTDAINSVVERSVKR